MAGFSIFLAGCTIPGVPDPQQVADQTMMLSNMQMQITSLMSGMKTLREQNAAMSGMLVQIYDTIKPAKTFINETATHGSASLFGSGDGMWLNGTGMEIIIPETVTWATTGKITVVEPQFPDTLPITGTEIHTGNTVQTGETVDTGTNTTMSLTTKLMLEKLRRANPPKTGNQAKSTTH